MSVSGLAPFDRRGHQRRVIIDALRRVETAARSEIAAETGLSPQAVTLVVDELVRDGLVREIGRRPSARGQPPMDLALNLDGGVVIGVQIEAGRVTGIACDLGGNIIARVTTACRTDDPNAALDTIRNLVDKLRTQARTDRERLWGVGIVLPGPFGPVDETDRDHLAMPTWSRAPFRAKFEEALSLPVFIGNDATAAAIGEHLNGVARDLRNFFYLYLGEGIGGGLFVEGQPVVGAFGNAGEIGRLPTFLPESGHVPVRLEAVASIDALRRMMLSRGCGDAATMDVDALFELDSKTCELWLAQAAQALRVAVATVENLLDPETIVVGGQIGESVLADLLRRMEPLLPSVSQRRDRPLRRIMPGSVGRLSPALGGATLPLFSNLTIQPRATKSPSKKTARQAQPAQARPRRRSSEGVLL